MASRNNAAWGIEVTGTNELRRAFKTLGEKDAPFLRDALDKAGRILESEAAKRAPGGIASGVGFAGVKGVGASIRAVVRIKHPGARSMEFGRVWYYRKAGTGVAGIGNNRPGSKRAKGSIKTKSNRNRVGGGQKARPFLGIIEGDQAISASHDRVANLLTDAYAAEWDRIGKGGA